jgi:putative ABC transport system permease protein
VPLRLWLRSIFRRSRVEQDLDDELSFHVAMEASVQADRGVGDAEALRRGRRSLGGYQQVKEACRDALRLGWLDTIARDVHYALRSFRRSPTFTLVALLSLAIGVGANCAAFTWADALLLRPLAVPNPSEVTNVGSTEWGAGAIGNVLRASYPEYVDIRDRAKSFAGLLAYTTLSAGLAASRDEIPRLTLGMMSSANFFDVLGLRPELGRWFLHAEGEVPGRDAVIVVSHRLWQSQFGGDPLLVGRRVYLTGIPFTVIGIAPPDFLGVEQFVQTDFYVPLMMWDQLLPRRGVHPLDARELRDLTLKGRLKPGVDLDSARAELTVLARDLARTHPETNSNRDLVVQTEFQVRATQIPLIGMLVALLTTLALAVLFVACANTAGLLTSRAPARAREMAVRSAIGAGRTGLVRQLMTESLLLAAGGGVLGLAVGYASMRMFRHVQIPTDLPIGPVFDLNRRALAVSIVVACVSALLFGLVPAIQASRVDLTAVMKGADDPLRRRRSWGQGLLVMGQVAVSVVLLVIATFAYRTFRRELTSGPGYRIDHLLMLSVDTGLVRYTDRESSQFFERLVERARAAPGVRSATLTSAVPMQTSNLNVTTLVPEGFAPRPGEDHISVMSAVVGEHYFSTIRIPIVRGREFQIEDSAQSPRVAIVNELFAERHWPGEDPLGRQLRVLNAGQPDTVAHVVGVAKTSKYMLLAEPPTEYVYLPVRQNPSANLILLAQSDGDPAALAAPLRNVVRSLDSHMPVYDLRTMQEFYDISTVGLMDTILGTIAAMGTMGLALALVGLYGLVAYAVSRRTKEIGVRMALGADRLSVLGMVMKQGVLLSSAGLAIGLLASAVAGELLAASFVGPDAGGKRDFTSLLLVAGAVLAVTGLAAYLPARRASRIDPVNALRYE